MIVKAKKVELKPCPFCGGNAIAKKIDCWQYDEGRTNKRPGTLYPVYCESCLAEIVEETREDSCEKWNARVAQKVKRGCWIENAEGKHFCSECGNYAFRIEFGSFGREWVEPYCHCCGAKMERGETQ